MIHSPSNGKWSLSEYRDAREINDRLFDQVALEGGGRRQRAEHKQLPWIRFPWLEAVFTRAVRALELLAALVGVSRSSKQDE